MSAPKSARISPESRPIAFTAVGVAALIYSGAFMASFFGLASLAAFMAIPVALQYVVPAVIDLALILFTLATLLRRARGLSTWKTNAATAFWILVSMAANTFHVLVAAGPASDWGVGTYAGATLSALMPLSALGASLVLENLLIEDPKRTESAAETKAAGAEPAGAQEKPAAAGQAPDAGVAYLEPAERRATPLTSAPTLPAPAARAKAAKASAPKPTAPTDAGQLVDQILAHKADGRSIPVIAGLVGKSESTVKRILKEAKAAAGETGDQDVETRAA